MMSALLAAWMAFSIGPVSGFDELPSDPPPPQFQKVLVLFSADTAKEDRDGFLAGLEEVRLQRLNASSTASCSPVGDNPHFLDVVDVRMVRTDRENPLFYEYEDPANSRLLDLEQLPALFWGNSSPEALIVVASDAISADLTRMIRNGPMGRENVTVYLFAGVSTFDESIREPHGTEPAKAPYAFAIQYPGDPWPNTDLALMSFPKTRKIILLAPRSWWSEDKMEKYREKVGPARAVKTMLLPKEDATGDDIEALKEQFAASVKAEIVPDETVIVSLSSIETGEDPISWLPKDFKMCPVFADTKPSRPSTVGGFCRSLRDLGVHAADLLDRLSEDSLDKNKLPAIIPEDDELWLNSHALRKYGLKTAGFPENAMLMSTSSSRAPVRLGYTWTRKRVAALLIVHTSVFLCIIAYVVKSLRDARRKRQISESVYNALPVRIIVMDRDGRLLEYHKPCGEVERVGAFPWNNINDVPWLRGLGIGETVREVFDSGKKCVREFVVEGSPRVVVLSRTETDVFGRPAVIAVSSDTPAKDAH